MKNNSIANQTVVSQERWLDARRELLQAEKEFSKQRDRLARTAQGTALGQGRPALCVRLAQGPRFAGGHVRGPQPAHGLSLHAGARLGGGLPGVLPGLGPL